MAVVKRMEVPRVPWHLWATGILGGLWSAIGIVSFILTRMNVEAVMSRFPPPQRAYFASLPPWAVGAWAIGVLAGGIGCLLLLRRSRLAIPALLASIIGMAICNLGGLFFLGGMTVMRETGGLGATVFPVVVPAVLASYARAMRLQGVLK
jgi:hypothetical protein